MKINVLYCIRILPDDGREDYFKIIDYGVYDYKNKTRVSILDLDNKTITGTYRKHEIPNYDLAKEIILELGCSNVQSKGLIERTNYRSYIKVNSNDIYEDDKQVVYTTLFSALTRREYHRIKKELL
jgi:hypothetical protein